MGSVTTLGVTSTQGGRLVFTNWVGRAAAPRRLVAAAQDERCRKAPCQEGTATYDRPSCNITCSTVLEPTDFYRTDLAPLHQQVLAHGIVEKYLSGLNIRYDGTELGPGDRFDLPFGDSSLSVREFSHLFSVFNGSRVHLQAEKLRSVDDAPPGLYFTVINYKIIQNQHKNKTGLVTEEAGAPGLFIDALHIDHFFLNEHKSPPSLGTFAFALCAITAHLAGLSHISLVAAGGKGFNQRHIGFKVWPKLGFDAQLLPDETVGIPHLAACRTVQDVRAIDSAWWDVNGSQRLMTFDLGAHSTAWRKLIPYVFEKLSSGNPHG